MSVLCQNSHVIDSLCFVSLVRVTAVSFKPILYFLRAVPALYSAVTR